MLEGVLGSLLKSTGDDVAANAARKMIGKSVLSTIIPEERISQRAPESLKIQAAAAQYLDNPQLPAPQAKSTVSVGPTAALKQEALKYKTADEFVKAQANKGLKQQNTVYHGKKVGGGETGDRYGKGLYVTNDRNRASGYADGGSVGEYSLDGVKLAKLDDKIDNKIVNSLKKEVNASLKRGDDSYKDIMRLSVGEKTFSASDVATARKFYADKKEIVNRLGFDSNSAVYRKNNDGSITVTYIDDTLESLKNIDGNRLFRSLPTPTAQSLIRSAGYDGASYRGIGGDTESVIYSGNLKSTKQQLTDLYNQANKPKVRSTNSRVTENPIYQLGVSKEAQMAADQQASETRAINPEVVKKRVALRGEQASPQAVELARHATVLNAQLKTAPPDARPAIRQALEDAKTEIRRQTGPNAAKIGQLRSYISEQEQMLATTKDRSTRAGAEKNIASAEKEIEQLSSPYPVRVYRGGKMEEILQEIPKSWTEGGLTPEMVQQDIAAMDKANASARPEFDMDAANAYLDKVAATGDENAFMMASEAVQRKIDETTALQAAYDDAMRLNKDEALIKEASKPIENITDADRAQMAFEDANQSGGKPPKRPGFMEQQAIERKQYKNRMAGKSPGPVVEAIERAIKPDVATQADAQTTIGEMTESGRQLGQAVTEVLDQNGYTYEQFSREIHEANREGRKAADWADKVYTKLVKPNLDAARSFGGVETGEQRYYLPQMRPGQEVDAKIGGTLVDLLDLGNDGYAMTRENRIPIDELDHTTKPLEGYFTRTSSVAYKNQITEQFIAEKIAEETGRQISEQEAKQIRQANEELSDMIEQAAEKRGGMDKFDMVGALNELGRMKGKEQRVLDAKVGKPGRQVSSSEEIYDSITLENGKTLSEETGFRRYTDADSLASGSLVEMGSQVDQYLMDQWKDTNVDDATKRKQAKSAQMAMNRVDEQLSAIEAQLTELSNVDVNTLSRKERRAYKKLLAHYEPIAQNFDSYAEDMRIAVIVKAEKNIARQEMVNFLESTDVQNKTLRKELNNDARRMLVQDKINRRFAITLAEKISGILHLGALGYNPVSAIQNITELTRAAAVMDHKTFVYALKAAAADKSGRILSRYGVRATNQFNIEEVNSKDPSTNLLRPMGGFNKSESFKDKVFLYGFEKQYRDKGLTGRELTSATKRDFDKFAVKSGMAGTLGFNKSATGKLFLQFFQYPIKDIKITLDMLGKAFNGKTNAESSQARKYLVKNFGARLPIYIMLNALFGASWEYVMGVFNPFGNAPQVDNDASNAEKVIAKVPMGPAPSMIRDLYFAIMEEGRAARDEEREVAYENFINGRVKRNAALLIPGGNQIFNRTGGFLSDLERGYNENERGKARFAAPQDDDLVNKARGLVFGKYSTDQAREYFGTEGIAGDAIKDAKNLLGQNDTRKYPVSTREQEKLAVELKGATDKAAVAKKLIDTSRERSAQRQEFEKKNPEAKAVVDASRKRTKDGKKLVSDVLTPEKWRTISSDTSGKAFERLKQEALNNNKDFGDKIDPIFAVSDKERRKEILNIRSRPTGDALEKEEILRATTDWYPAFEKAEADYYASLDFKDDPSSPFTNSERKKKWQKLSKENSALYNNQPAFVKQYWKLKETDEYAAKQYYKNNADALSSYFENYRAQRLSIINQKRELEGYPPIDAKTFANATYGFDEKDTQYGYNSKSGSKKVKNFAADIPTGAPKQTKKVTFKKPTALKKVAIAKAKVGKAKVSMKKSLVQMVMYSTMKQREKQK